MISWESWTWIAIAVLIFGSIAALLWFLRDLARLFRNQWNDRGEDLGG